VDDLGVMKSASAKADALREMLAQLWKRSVPTVLERLETLDEAAAAAEGGAIPEAVRERALANAHKLSGSLGMFGYTEGTNLAREIEALLDSDKPNADRLVLLVKKLRAELT
jgi:HPt (histidine-containing phosphotransfer) domain-containing protein